MTGIRLVRLINGDELITEVVGLYKDGSKQFLVIKEPLLVQGDESGNVILLSYIPFASSNQIEIDCRHIVTRSEIHPEMERYYNNSLICNQRFSDPAMIERVRETNRQIELQLEEPQPQVVTAVPLSKSLH